MNTPSPIKAPQQKRSRETLERLLAATVKVVNEFGLEGAVIPRIAAAAEVSPASVYRRFTDKDALLRAAFLRVLQQSNVNNREQLDTVLLRATLADTAKRLTTLLMMQYRAQKHLVRALNQFLEADSDAAFMREARGIVADNFKLLAEAMLVHRDEIVHAQPERALRIAIMTAGSSIEMYALDRTEMWQAVQTLTDEEMVLEIAHFFVAYLKTPLPSA